MRPQDRPHNVAPDTLAARTRTLALWQPLIEAMLHAVWLVDAQSLRIVAANRAAGMLLGMPLVELIGTEVLDLAATPEDLCFWGDVAGHVDGGRAQQIESETYVTRRDGTAAPVLRRVCRLHMADAAAGAADSARDGGADGALYCVALHDRSQQVRVERELELTVADLRATLESTQDGLLVTDLAGRIRNFNQRFAQVWGVPQALLGKRADDGVLDWMRASVTEPGAYMRRLAALDADAMLKATDLLELQGGRVLERVAMPQCTQGQPIGRVFSFRDITERIEATRRIQQLATTDALTALPNRRLLAEHIEAALARAQRDGARFALLFMNLDHFQHINETLGRALGDRVLLDVAERVKASLRQADTVARLGGDEFVVLTHQADEAGAESAAQRMLDAFKRPFTHAGMSFTVTASVGIALYPNDGATMDELLRRAEAAMREAKLAGRANYRLHQPRPAHADARTRTRTRMQLDHAMRQALNEGQFRLHYQPQVSLHTGDVVGCEALIRWRDAVLGEVSPGEFIPVAEESGFIIAIGDWVLHEAVRQAAQWLAAGRGVAVSVNVSALQFQQPGFVNGVARALHAAGLPAKWIELELTESCLVHDAQDAMLRLQALARLGVRLAIDDFGIGYSSLSYLKRFPISRLKIDRSFVGGLPAGESDVGIVQAIINMGRALRLEIVAEGVETEAQREFLQAAGCHLFQGFLYAPALDAAAFEARVAGALGATPA